MGAYPFRLPPAMEDFLQRTEKAEQAEFEQRQRDQAEAERDRAWNAAHNERMFEYLHGCSRAEWMKAVTGIQEAKETRDATAEWGSGRRPAVRMGGVDLRPREEAIGPVTMPPDAIEAQLRRARQQPGREFMQRQVAELERRQQGGGRTITRSETPEGIGCVECIEANATVDEWIALHHSDNPLPEVRVPDHAPSRSRRTSGTGWPREIVR